MSSPLQSSYFFKFLHFSTRFCCFLPAGTANKKRFAWITDKVARHPWALSSTCHQNWLCP